MDSSFTLGCGSVGTPDTAFFPNSVWRYISETVPHLTVSCVNIFQGTNGAYIVHVAWYTFNINSSCATFLVITTSTLTTDRNRESRRESGFQG